MLSFVPNISELCKMKLRATIIEDVNHDDQSIIVKFEGDPRNQHFELKFKEDKPYGYRMRKWDTWMFTVKWESEIFEDAKGKKSYFTHLYATKWEYISGVMGD